MSIITVCALVARRRGRCALAPSPSGRSRGQFKTRMVFATINKSAARTSAKVICPRGLVEQQASSPFDLSHRGALLQANGQAPVSAAEPKLRPRTTRTSTRASRAWDVAAYSTVQFYPSQLALAMPGPPRVTDAECSTAPSRKHWRVQLDYGIGIACVSTTNYLERNRCFAIG